MCAIVKISLRTLSFFPKSGQMSRRHEENFSPLRRANTLNETRNVSSDPKMLFKKHRQTFRLEKKSPTRIPTRWKFVVVGLIGSGAGLLFLTMWSPSSKDDSTIEQNPQLHVFARTNNSVSQRMAKTTSGCTIAACKTVTCSAIPESENPGRFASDFITKMLPVLCSSTNVIDQLEFRSCTFPNKKLDADWLTIKWPIQRLSFVDCVLEDLPPASFSSPIYSSLRSLTITRAKVKFLKKSIFQELSNLQQFLLTDNPIEGAEMNLLSGVADSLEDLSLEGSLKGIEVLENITGRVTLTKVKNLYLRRNFLTTISSQAFSSLPNVVAIHLKGSSIQELDPDTFKLTGSLESLDLSDNSLTTLPLGIFTPILSKNQNFQLSMSQNLWHCACDFEWILDLIKTSIILTETPKCTTPERNAFLYFTSAQFCDLSSPQVQTTLATTTRSSGSSGSSEDVEKTENYVKFTCENEQDVRVSRRKLFATEEWKFPSRHQDFSLRYLSNGHIEINFKSIAGQRVSIIWFENIATSDSEKIDCLTNLQGPPVLLKNLSTNSTYTICLLENLEESPSPLNCLAARTMSSLSADSASSSGSAAVWLTNEDKSVVISVAITLFLIVSLLSAISSLFLIRRNPSLLRGSKRIIMVKKRGVDALVMPKATSFPRPGANNAGSKENCLAEKSLRKNYESIYLTPLKTQISILDRKSSISTISPRRKDSKVSRVSSLYSTGSYVSGIEATPSELYNWRSTLRSKNLYGACIEDEEFYGTPETPPPLPYRALNPLVSSLPLAVDADDRADTFVHF